MKKIVLALAGALAAVAFAPEASAVPVFARQTGMACNACHFQHFPLLNSFGRAFKSSGFTMMGAQAKVEGENLSIPAYLNLGVETTTGIESVSGSTGNNTGGGTMTGGGNKAWFVPGSGGELSIFFGGRMSEFAGFVGEIGMTGPGGAVTTNSVKLPILFDMGGGTRVGVVAYTGGQGAAYSFELLNTGAANTHKMAVLDGNNQGAPLTAGGTHAYTSVYSASQYLGTKTDATGLSFVAVNPNLGFVNIGKYDVAGAGTSTAGALPLTYMRVAGTFNAAGYDVGLGVQSFSGTTNTVLSQEVKATVFDFQAQGEVAGMGLGVYTSYGRAPNVTSAGGSNLLNVANVANRSAFGIGAELGVLPGKATLQLAYRNGRSGAGGSVDGDNAILIGATYELAQNMELSLTHMSQSGSAWDVTAPVGKNMTGLMLEALF